MVSVEPSPSRDRNPLLGWPGVVIGLAWVWLCVLHWGNDGLWAPDAARHFANGQFWGDFLQAFRLDARDYALSYYARYPVIKPSAYPPVFYLFEAAAFAILGASPYVAKGLILLFSLMAALYTGYWLGRFVAPSMAFAGAAVLLLPETVIQSHAIMLHVPSLAFATASMVHARLWLDSDERSPAWRHFWLAFVFGGLAVGSYFHAAVMAFVAVAWILVERRWVLLANRWAFIAAGTLGALVLVLLPFLIRWAPAQLSFATPRMEWITELRIWTFYAKRLPTLFTGPLLFVAAAGFLGGLLLPRWRREARILGVWFLVPYLLLSLAPTKEDRYILYLGPPLVGLAVVGIRVAADLLARRLRERDEGRDPTERIAMAGAALLLALLLVLSPRADVPRVDGFRELVAFVEENAPDEAVFYDGPAHGIFISYLQAGDPGYERRVVVGSKLLYSYMVMISWRLEEFASSPAEVEDLLRRRTGARYVLVETGHQSEEIAVQRHLREAVKGSGFEFVRSFPLDGWRVERVDVYRILGEIEEPTTVDLPFPILGEDVRYEVEPIQP